MKDLKDLNTFECKYDIIPKNTNDISGKELKMYSEQPRRMLGERKRELEIENMKKSKLTISKNKTIKKSKNAKKYILRRRMAAVLFSTVLASSLVAGNKAIKNHEIIQNQNNITMAVEDESEKYEFNIIEDEKAKFVKCEKDEREKFAEFYANVKCIDEINTKKNITYEDELKKQEAEYEVVEYVLSGDLKEMADKIIKGKIKYAYADGNYLNKDFRLKDNFAYTGDGIILNGIMYGKKDYKETDKTGMKDFLDLVFCMNEYKTEDEWKKANASKDEIVKFGCKMGNSIWHTINTDYIMDSNGSIERKCAKTEKYNKPILTNLQKADIDDIDR